jgi:hypothetical protein
MGKTLMTSLSGVSRASSAFLPAAIRSAATFALGTGVTSALGTTALGLMPVIDGKPAHLNPGEVALSFFLGVGAGALGGGYGFSSETLQLSIT